MDARTDRIDIDVFKVVTRAIAESDDLVIMANHLTQLLSGALGIKGCSIFVLNRQTEELEVIASFGLSLDYLNKGPLLASRTFARTLRGEAIAISDVSQASHLQYPNATRSEGIAAIVAIPVVIHGDVIGEIRFYHHEVWDISNQDLDSLKVLTEVIGLALNYTRLVNGVRITRQVMGEFVADFPSILGD
jgi:signal transduction protein with GAF and PtsI domain